MSTNVYADLGFARPEEAIAKAKIVSAIADAIEQKRLTQAQAGELLGISQPKVSALLSGHFHGYTLDRLLRFLNKLDRRVEISISGSAVPKEASKTLVTVASAV